MRVTEKMLFNSTITRTGKSRENLQRAQNEVSGGMRVEHPGDDPVAAGLSVIHAVDKARFEAVGSAAQRAADELNAADTALDSITTVANRVLQVATQFGNDTYTSLDRSTAAVEVGGLFKETLSLLNTRTVVAIYSLDTTIRPCPSMQPGPTWAIPIPEPSRWLLDFSNPPHCGRM